MYKMYVDRILSSYLIQVSKQFPVIFLTGPRQSGKTTLLKHIFPDFRYLNLEDPELRQWATEDPKEFLALNPSPCIIDEAQHVPSLFSYIQLIVDDNGHPGQFILSGSQNFLLMEQITQSLAGRNAVLSLLPFSYTELLHAGLALDTHDLILKGFYPRLYQSISDYPLFYKSYLNTYVEKDIRSLSNISNLNDFIRFMKLCAGRVGELLNISSLSNEAGIAYNTCKSWLSFLNTSYIIQLVQPYHKNFNKRMVKSPKLYFTDTGLLSYLLGIKSIETLALHPFKGKIFENLVFSELFKSRINHGEERNIWFWRDNHGTEIDFILEKEQSIQCIEVKSGMNFQKNYLKNIRAFTKYNPSLTESYLLYNGSVERKIDGTNLMNWKNYVSSCL